MRVAAPVVALVCASLMAASTIAAQTVMAPRPNTPLPGAGVVERCTKFTDHLPKELLPASARSALWTTDAAETLSGCLDREHTALDEQLKAPAANARQILEREFLVLRRMTHWYDDIRGAYKRSSKDHPSTATRQHLSESDKMANLTQHFVAYQAAVQEELKAHSLLQPFSGVLKAGAAFLERGSSSDTSATLTQPRPPGAATTSNGSPLAHIDFESKHFGADRGTFVDASFTASLGFQPALAFFKPKGLTINGQPTAVAEATAYENAFVFNVGGNLHVSTFHAGEISVLGRIGAVNLMNDVTVVDQGAQSYIAVPFGGDNTRLYGEVGIMANLYDGGLELAHLEKTHLMPLFHVEAGLRQDPRFESSGPGFFRPASRSFVRVSADNVPVLGTFGSESKTFSIGFAWEYDGPWPAWPQKVFGTPGPNELTIPSGNRFVIRGDVNLLKALKPPPTTNDGARTHKDQGPAPAPDSRPVAASTTPSSSTGTSSTPPAGTEAPRPTGGIASATMPSTTVSSEARQTLVLDVFDKDHGNRVVAHVAVDDDPTPIERETDGNGHIEFNLKPGPRGFTVTAHDYEPFRNPQVDNSLFGNPPGSQPRLVEVRLTHKPVPAATRPGKAAVLNMRANFFGGLDCRGGRIFDPMIAVVEDRDCWYSAKKAQGLTHIVLSPALQYPGFTSFDWWHNDPAQFRELVLDVLNHGFVPVILLAQGEHFKERNNGHATNAALTDHLERDFRQLLPALKDLAPFAIWAPGWEVIGPPEYWWTAFQLTRTIDLMAELLGDGAVIAVHAQPNRVTGASFCGTNPDRNASMGGCVAVSPNPDGTQNFIEPDDPSRGDEIGWFSTSAGRRVKMWLFQMDHDRHMADDGLKPCASAYGRVCETLRRWVPEDRQTAALKANSAPGPQWFRDQRPIFCAFETGALNVKDGHFGPEMLKVIAKRLSDVGVTCFGNGVP